MITFRKLWDRHPTIAGDDNPCTTKNKKNFQNQCAIRVGAALARCGYDTRRIPGARHCWHHPTASGHVLAAEELAQGLARVPVPGLAPVERYSSSEFMDKAAGKTGIVFFKDYWHRSQDTQGSPTGDHIDLWNGSRLTDWRTWARFHMRIGNIGMHSLSDNVSDYLASEQIWFWRVG